MRGFDYKKFDVSGFIPTAKKLATHVFDDAVFFRLDADGVLEDGTANLTLQDGMSITYRFMSPSRAKRPKNLPLGVEHKPTCLVYVSVDPRHSYLHAVDEWKCDDPPLPPPRCSMKDVWKKARTKGAPGGAVAEIGYWADRKGKGRFSFDIPDTKHDFWIEDC
jgi:hypothetical protein